MGKQISNKTLCESVARHGAMNLVLSVINGQGKERDTILRFIGSKSSGQASCYREALFFWKLNPERNLSHGSS